MLQLQIGLSLLRSQNRNLTPREIVVCRNGKGEYNAKIEFWQSTDEEDGEISPWEGSELDWLQRSAARGTLALGKFLHANNQSCGTNTSNHLATQ